MTYLCKKYLSAFVIILFSSTTVAVNQKNRTDRHALTEEEKKLFASSWSYRLPAQIKLLPKHRKITKRTRFHTLTHVSKRCALLLR